MAGDYFRSAVNEIAYRLRRRKTFGSFVEPALEEEILPSFARAMLASERAEYLKEKYRLHPLEAHALYLGTLFLIDLFDRLFEERPELEFLGGRVLDVGARDFESAPAIDFALRARGIVPRLTGIELDAYRTSPAGASCAEVGTARAARLGADHRYLAGDIFDHRESYDLILWLHPFLDREKLLEWGLPLRFLRPAAMFEHVYGLLAPGGLLLIVNQDAAEKSAQRALFEQLGKKYESLDIPLYFRARDEPAYVHLLRSPVL